jgi:hypothetical protein
MRGCAVKKRWRTPKAKPGELLIKYGKPDRHNNPDIVYVNGPGTHHGDGHFLYYMLGTPRLARDYSNNNASHTYQPIYTYEDSFLQQLEKRGYDLETLKFSIQKKKENIIMSADYVAIEHRIAEALAERAISDKQRIFVFGSNLSGIHGAGAAAFAYKKHGAVWKQGEGWAGNSYALPTVGKNIEPMTLAEVVPHVNTFLQFAKNHPEFEFQVTRVGCGLAGFTDAEIAPLFAGAPENCLFDTAWRTYLPDAQFWGTF